MTSERQEDRIPSLGAHPWDPTTKNAGRDPDHSLAILAILLAGPVRSDEASVHKSRTDTSRRESLRTHRYKSSASAVEAHLA
jgi:hypothetical protein